MCVSRLVRVCASVRLCVCVCGWVEGGHLASHGGRRTATLRLSSADLPPPPPQSEVIRAIMLAGSPYLTLPPTLPGRTQLSMDEVMMGCAFIGRDGQPGADATVAAALAAGIHRHGRAAATLL